jgi:alginate O-acetyltransferase complex protein AlgI
VTLFPQLVAGPIVRYADIEKTLTQGIDFDKIHADFERGIIRFTTGLAKKVLIANVLGEFVAEVSALEVRTVLISWAYAAAVSLQIYFDFSGYSDMAIGLGAMLGFEFPENFRYPFISKSISEFWRRWHITLGAWFRDYVYIPMGGNRVSLIRWIFNILVVWLFTGLWHGAGWNFILWGLYFAVFLVAEKFAGKSVKKFQVQNKGGFSSLIKAAVSHIYVVIVIMISFLIFNGSTVETAWNDIVRLVKADGGLSKDSLLNCSFILKNRLGILVIGVVGATPLPVTVWNKIRGFLGFGDIVSHGLTVIYVLSLFILCTVYIIDGSFNPFLYFRF